VAMTLKLKAEHILKQEIINIMHSAKTPYLFLERALTGQSVRGIKASESRASSFVPETAVAYTHHIVGWGNALSLPFPL